MFNDLNSQTMTVSGEQITVNGTEATVTCQVSSRAVGKAGGRPLPPTNMRATFSLRKENGQWIITGRR